MQRGERSDTRIHTNSPTGHRGAAKPRSGQARRSHKRKQDDVSSEGATNRKRVTAQRPEGAKHRRDKYKGQPNGGADPPKWGERGRTPRAARGSAGSQREPRGATAAKRGRGRGTEGRKTNQPREAGQKSPGGANRCADGGAQEGATTEPTDREGSPPDRPQERQRGRERATEAPQGRTTRAAPTNELAREGAIRANQTDTLQVPGRANSRKHEGRKQETQTKSAPSRGARDPRHCARTAKRIGGTRSSKKTTRGGARGEGAGAEAVPPRESRDYGVGATEPRSWGRVPRSAATATEQTRP